MFEDTAKLLIKEYGDTKALCLALAKITNTTAKLQNKSMLTGQEDCLTYELICTEAFRSVSYVWGILKNLLSPGIADSIKGMRCYSNMKGGVFDVPDEYTERFEEAFEYAKTQKFELSYTIQKAKELPEL
jgi:hypothetical protein